MALATLTDPRWAVIWINATAPGIPASGSPSAKKLCAINSKALNQSLATGTAIVPDCADPTKVSVIKRTAVSRDWAINGAGYMELSLRNDLQAIMNGAVSVPLVFQLDNTSAGDVSPNDGYYAGRGFLETFNIIANNTESYITVDLNFTADGDLTWTSVP